MKLTAATVGMWFVLLVVAMLLGGSREIWLNRLLGECTAHQLETIVVCLIHLVLIRCFVVRMMVSQFEAIRIGLTWTAMLLLFEFTFFPFVVGVPYQEVTVFLFAILVAAGITLTRYSHNAGSTSEQL